MAHFLSVYFFLIDPQHFVDGSTSSPGYSVIGENPGLFKFWSLFFFYVDQFEQSSGPGHHPMQSTMVGGITYKRGGKVAGHGS